VEAGVIRKTFDSTRSAPRTFPVRSRKPRASRIGLAKNQVGNPDAAVEEIPLAISRRDGLSRVDGAQACSRARASCAVLLSHLIPAVHKEESSHA